MGTGQIDFKTELSISFKRSRFPLITLPCSIQTSTGATPKAQQGRNFENKITRKLCRSTENFRDPTDGSAMQLVSTIDKKCVDTGIFESLSSVLGTNYFIYKYSQASIAILL